MKKRISQPNLYVRTAYYFDKLRADTGKGHRELWELVDKAQYQAFGLQGPALETIRDYARARRSPAVDFGHTAVPPWLMAAELQFPHSSYNFFHPLFDLMFGQVESSANWEEKLQKIPSEWIEQQKELGQLDVAEEWERINQNLTTSPGRKRRKTPMDRLSFVHLNLLRLPKKITEVLFMPAGSGGNYFRRYKPVLDEIDCLNSIESLDGLSLKNFPGLTENFSTLIDRCRNYEGMTSQRNSEKEVRPSATYK